MRKSLFIFVLMLFGMPALAIRGGEMVDDDDLIAKSTVFVNGTGDCTGTIIDFDTVLTAAHCLTGTIARIIFSTAINQNAYEQHGSYSRKFLLRYSADLALVHLEGKLPSGYKPIPFAKESEDEIGIGETSIIAGFGLFDAYLNDTGGRLRKASLVRISPLRNDFATFDQTQGSGACFGDSGGPAFTKTPKGLIVWGVMSQLYRTAPSNPCAYYSLYTRTSINSGWISEGINQLRVP